MSTEARAGHFPAIDWEGGALPYRVGHRKLGMWLFIVSDSLTFSALLIGYSYLRASNVWPTPFPFYPSIVFASVMTFCLRRLPCPYYRCNHEMRGAFSCRARSHRALCDDCLRDPDRHGRRQTRR